MSPRGACSIVRDVGCPGGVLLVGLRGVLVRLRIRDDALN